jgi:hypothetical protein
MHNTVLKYFMFLILDKSISVLMLFYKVLFNKLGAFTALRFTVTGAPPAAKRTRILPMTQHTNNIWNEGKFLPLFTDHRRC